MNPNDWPFVLSLLLRSLILSSPLVFALDPGFASSLRSPTLRFVPVLILVLLVFVPFQRFSLRRDSSREEERDKETKERKMRRKRQRGRESGKEEKKKKETMREKKKERKKETREKKKKKGGEVSN